MTKQFGIIWFLCWWSWYSSAQVLKEKTELLFNSRKRLVEKTQESYNPKGQIAKSTRTDGRETSVSILEYKYNVKGQLIVEKHSAFRSYRENVVKHWTDTSIISIIHYIYDDLGRLKFEKDYSFECSLDSCDITEYFYNGNLLIKKFCTNDCSLKGHGYNYPIYYKYDEAGSLILEQGWGPIDTSKVWYANTYDYSFVPDRFVHEKYYRRDDSLQLEHRSISSTEYRDDGQKHQVNFLGGGLSYDSYNYYTNGKLKSVTTIVNGKPKRKQVYYYDKFKQLSKLKTYEAEMFRDKLKLHYYQLFEYEYY